jgi:hypothetical protein
MLKLLLLFTLSFFGVGVSLSLSQHAEAQQIRFLPANGKRGTTGTKQALPLLIINRETLRLAPGGLIFDINNRTILHGSLPMGADIWYQLNFSGEVQRIYILRPDEQTRLDQGKN